MKERFIYANCCGSHKPPQRTPPVPAPLPNVATIYKGSETCLICWRRVIKRKDGRIRKHYHKVWDGNKYININKLCPNSGKEWRE